MKNPVKKLAAALVAIIIVGQSISASAVTITESATYKVQSFDTNTKPFEEKLIAVKQKGKWGFMDVKGKMAIAATYERTYNFSEGLAAVKKGGKWGFINKNNKFVIKPSFSSVSTDEFYNGYAAVKKNGKWGLINKKGKTVLPYAYQAVSIYKEGLVSIKKNNKYGFVNLKNKVVIKPTYNYVIDFYEGLAGAVNKDGKVGYINKKGKTVIKFNYTNGYNFDNGRAQVQNEKGLYGVIDKKGKVVVPFKYTSVTMAENSILGYSIGYGKVGYLNMKTGKKAFSIPWTNSEIFPFSNGVVFYANAHSGIIDTVYTKKGQKIKLKNEYNMVMYFNNNYALGELNDEKGKIKIMHKK